MYRNNILHAWLGSDIYKILSLPGIIPYSDSQKC